MLSAYSLRESIQAGSREAELAGLAEATFEAPIEEAERLARALQEATKGRATVIRV